MKNKLISSAFTLAEALLTITIIGVVAVMMVRSINRVSPDKEKIMFVKTFHSVEHVVANIINDPTKYNQNYYSEEDLKALSSSELNELAANFLSDPLKSASVFVGGEIIYACGNPKASSSKCINKTNAKCYFIADALNTTGTVDCETKEKTAINFKTSTGVCVRNLVSLDTNGYTEAIFDPLCTSKKETKNNQEVESYTGGYAIGIYQDGKVTVPQTSTNATEQSKAYNWLLDQTQVK